MPDSNLIGIWLWWAPLVAVSLHIVEEFVYPGGFAAWDREYRPSIRDSITPRLHVVVNGLLLAACVTVGISGMQNGVLAVGGLRFRSPIPPALAAPAWLTLAALLFSNAVFHVVGTYRTGRVSPGVRTGVLLYVPLAVVGYWQFPRAGGVSVVGASLCALLGGSYHLWASLAHRWRAAAVLVLAAAFVAAPSFAHPGSGIVVDRSGEVYFVDMVSGVWKLDAQGGLTHVPGPAFHWMALDASDRFAAANLPSGPGGDFARLGAKPTLILASDFPIAIGRDGSLLYPSHSGGTPVRVFRFSPAGQSSTLVSLPATTAHGPLLYLNGLAAGPDGSVYYTESDAIRRIGSDGQLSTVVENIASLACAPAPTKRAKSDPMLQGLDVGADGAIYVAATGCGNVLKVTAGGRVTILPQVSNAWVPTGVALFGSDLYVLEFQNADTDDRRKMLPRVRKIEAGGKTTIVATPARSRPQP